MAQEQWQGSAYDQSLRDERVVASSQPQSDLPSSHQPHHSHHYHHSHHRQQQPQHLIQHLEGDDTYRSQASFGDSYLAMFMGGNEVSHGDDPISYQEQPKLLVPNTSSNEQVSGHDGHLANTTTGKSFDASFPLDYAVAEQDETSKPLPVDDGHDRFDLEEGSSRSMPEITQLSPITDLQVLRSGSKAVEEEDQLEEEEEEEEDGDLNEMSMDFTRMASGKIREELEEADEVCEDVEPEEMSTSAKVAGLTDGPSPKEDQLEGDNGAVSQKENAVPSVSATSLNVVGLSASPGQAQSRITVGTSASNLISREESTHPSSSPAVAMNLLAGRRSPTKRGASSIRVTTEPPSSGEFNGSALLPNRDSNRGNDHLRLNEVDGDGPPTSTPALSGAALPNPPETVERPQTFSILPDPIAGPSRSRASSRKPMSPNKPRALYQSSAAMRNRAPTPPPPKKKDPMDETQETDETPAEEAEHLPLERSNDDMELEAEPARELNDSAELGDLASSPSRDDTMGEKDMTIDVTRGAGGYSGTQEDSQFADGDSEVDTPRRAIIVARVPTLLSEESSGLQGVESGGNGEGENEDEGFGDDPPEVPARTGVHFSLPSPMSNDDGGSLDVPVSSGTSDQSSLALGYGDRSMGLTEIGDLSSQPGPSACSIEPTQMYDVERAGPASLGFRRTQPESDLSDRSAPTFEFETTESSIRQKPLPNRALRRMPPPPTPTLVRAHMSVLESSLGRSPNVEEPTQIEEMTGDLSSSSPAAPYEMTLPTRFKPRKASAGPSSKVLVPASEEGTQIDDFVAMDVDSGLERIGSSAELELSKGPEKPQSMRAMSPEPAQDSAISRVASSSSDLVQSSVSPLDPAETLKAQEASSSPPRNRSKGKARAMGVDEEDHESLDPLDTLPRRRVRRPSSKLVDSLALKAKTTPAVTAAPAFPSSPPLPSLPPTSSSLSSLPPSSSLTAAERTVPSNQVYDPPTKKRKLSATSATKRYSGGRPRNVVARRSKSNTSNDAVESGHRKSELGPSRAVRIASPAPIPVIQAAERSRTHSLAPSDTTGDIKPKLPKSKLPATAPFSRVFALWRDDLWLYPATAIDVSGGKVSVVFDDGSKGKVKFTEIRRPELQRGDWVRYRGDEGIESETQASALDQDVRVFRVESAVDGSDVKGACDREDVVATTAARISLDEQPELAVQNQLQRLLVCAIAIPPQHTVQFDNRRLTAVDIAGFEGKPILPAKPPNLVSIPPTEKLEPFQLVNKENSLFNGMAFLVTSSKPENEKRVLLDSLRAHGASVIEVHDLFSVETGQKGGQINVNYHAQSLAPIDTVLLLTEQARTSPKFLVALALRIPCISPVFISESIEQSARRDWRQYAISPGFDQSLQAPSVYAQWRAMSRPSFDIKSLVQSHKEGSGVFHNRSFLLVVQKAQIRNVLSVVAAAGASMFHVVASLEAASQAGHGYDHVVLEDSSKVPSKLKDHKGVGSMTWLKQCLIAGYLVNPSMMKPNSKEGDSAC